MRIPKIIRIRRKSSVLEFRFIKEYKKFFLYERIADTKERTL